MSALSSISASFAAAPTPGPIPERAPSAPQAPASLRPDSVARPVALPSPGHANRQHLGADAALPVLAAAVVIGAGAVVALPAIGLGAGALAEAASTLGGSLGRGADYVKTAVTDISAEYRAGAGRLARLEVRDPHAVGKAIGAQAWTSTEETVRGSIAGAAFGGSAWAAGKLCSWAADALTGNQRHARP